MLTAAQVSSDPVGYIATCLLVAVVGWVIWRALS